MGNGLEIPPVPEKIKEYRQVIWTETHLMRRDFNAFIVAQKKINEQYEERLQTVENDVTVARIWGKVSTGFLGILAMIVGIWKGLAYLLSLLREL